MNEIDESHLYNLPDNCKSILIKQLVFHKMKAKYKASFHPFPKLEGELILFKPNKADQTKGSDSIVYRDYSLAYRSADIPCSELDLIKMAKKNSFGKKPEEIKQPPIE